MAVPNRISRLFSGEECVNKNLNCVRAERAVVYSYALPSKFVCAERAVCSMAFIAGQQPGFHLFNRNFHPVGFKS